jgi:DNA-binding LytR/AlgR family response regulator
MEKIKFLVVDDEPIAREIVQTYCAHLPYLQVVAACANAIEAKVILKQQPIDIIFLDINMPVLDGIAFLKTLKNPPQVIFTTAYKEYAIDAFDLSAVDYLLKPFSLDRFIIAVDKAIEKLHGQAGKISTQEEAPKEDFIFIKADGKIFKILHRDLLFAEASGNYTKVVTGSKTYLSNITFSSFEDQLPKSVFLRVQRSFIINKTKIAYIEGNRVFIDKTEIPIGSNYKEAFLKALGLTE